MCHALTQGIRNPKTFTKYEKCYCINLSPQKTREAVSNAEITVIK